MMKFESLTEAAAFLSGVLPGRLVAGKVAGLEEGGKILADEMKAQLGHYQAGDIPLADWKELSPATIADKMAGGFPVPSPLLRSGAMRDSISNTVADDGSEAVAGSTDPVAVYQEQGTARRGVPGQPGMSVEPGIPSRSFIARGAYRKGSETVDAISARVVAAISGEVIP